MQTPYIYPPLSGICIQDKGKVRAHKAYALN
jgi:hypothetical protein